MSMYPSSISAERNVQEPMAPFYRRFPTASRFSGYERSKSYLAGSRIWLGTAVKVGLVATAILSWILFFLAGTVCAHTQTAGVSHGVFYEFMEDGDL